MSALKPGQRVYVASGRVFGIVAEVLDMGILNRVSVSVLLDGGGAGLYAPSDLYTRGDEPLVEPDPGPQCTGLAARWCPRCGDCTCPEEEREVRGLNSDACPLHALFTSHAECGGND